MAEADARTRRIDPRARWEHLAAACVLAVACFGVYANAYDHAFHLDSHHVIVDNPAVRDLGSVPRYFRDPGTFSVLRTNVDYRPVLQTSYALNHAWSGYEMYSWHAVQIALHLIVCFALYLLGTSLHRSLRPEARSGERLVVALGAALVFALHPAHAGVVDYLSARSSLLVAALLLPAFLLVRGASSPGAWVRLAGATGLYTIALFAKVEAVAALGVFVLLEVWREAESRKSPEERRGFFGDLAATLRSGALLRFVPALLVTGLYFAIYQSVMADFDFEQARRRAGVSELDYLHTQVVAWWHYVHRWVAPFGLVADDASFAVRRSLREAPVLLALGGWLLAGGVLLALWRRAPGLLVLALSGLALLSPTSSFLPLAEMVNEHRPYAPIGLLSLVVLIPLFDAVIRATARSRLARTLVALGFVGMLSGLAMLTWERNTVFATEESFWADTVEKAPSGRSHVNFGKIRMGTGDYDEARRHFELALGFAPYWHIIHINLGVLHRAQGRTEDADRHFDLAVQYDTLSPTALTWRGEHHLQAGRYDRAATDFDLASRTSLERYRVAKGRATAYAGLANDQEALRSLRDCLSIDPGLVPFDIVAIASPFFATTEGQRSGVRFFEALVEELPGTWWVHANLGALAGRLGDAERAEAERERGRALRNTPPGA